MYKLLLFTQHCPAGCLGMYMPKSQDIQGKTPSPKVLCLPVTATLFTQTASVKAQRKQFLQKIDFIILCTFCYNYLKCIRITKFSHYLTADTARRAVIKFLFFLRFSHNGYGAELLFLFINCPEQSCPLRAVAGSIGSIFNVAASVNTSVSAQKRRPYLKMRIGSIRPFL